VFIGHDYHRRCHVGNRNKHILASISIGFCSSSIKYCSRCVADNRSRFTKMCSSRDQMHTARDTRDYRMRWDWYPKKKGKQTRFSPCSRVYRFIDASNKWKSPLHQEVLGKYTDVNESKINRQQKYYSRVINIRSYVCVMIRICYR